jgi:hypothetical protein
MYSAQPQPSPACEAAGPPAFTGDPRHHDPPHRRTGIERLPRPPLSREWGATSEPHRALMSVQNMNLDCSQAMQGHAGPRHKPRLHRDSALLSASPPHAKVAFQRCALRHLTHLPNSGRRVLAYLCAGLDAVGGCSDVNSVFFAQREHADRRLFSWRPACRFRDPGEQIICFAWPAHGSSAPSSFHVTAGSDLELPGVGGISDDGTGLARRRRNHPPLPATAPRNRGTPPPVSPSPPPSADH